MASQYVQEVFPEASSSRKGMGLADSRAFADVGDLLLLPREEQQRHLLEETPEKWRAQMQSLN
jgi:hypothetical protein